MVTFYCENLSGSFKVVYLLIFSSGQHFGNDDYVDDKREFVRSILYNCCAQ